MNKKSSIRCDMPDTFYLSSMIHCKDVLKLLSNGDDELVPLVNIYKSEMSHPTQSLKSDNLKD